MKDNRGNVELDLGSLEEYTRNRSVDLGNELLNRAKEVSQKIEERVRALCGESDKLEG